MNTEKHYDLLIDEENDPVYDPPELKSYMDGWDGKKFIDSLGDISDKSVLEIGVGTGRLALRVCGRCRIFTGIDLSQKTAERAVKNMMLYKNVEILCGDFLKFRFPNKYDIIYSSLTFLHIKKKKQAFKKVYLLLNPQGKFVLSIDKAKNRYLDFGTRRLRIYPDDEASTEQKLINCGFTVTKFEAEKAIIFVCEKI